MAKRKLAVVAPADNMRPDDPSLRTTPIKMDGIDYTMCLDLRSLAAGEARLNRAGASINLIQALPRLNLESTMVIFPCSIQRFHPNIGFEEAQKLVSLNNLWDIVAAVQSAWEQAMPAPKPDSGTDPPPPSQ